MSIFTNFLNLFKKDPVADKDDTFSITTMLNDNWDKIDAGVSIISQKQEASLKFPTATGSATAIVVNTGTFDLEDGQTFTFIPSADNNGAATTINPDTKGAIPIYKPATTTAPKLVEGKPATVWYNLAGNCFFIKASAEGNATVANVLAGKEFSNGDDVGLVGTMVNREGDNAALGSSVLGTTLKFIPPSGYYDGLDDNVNLTDADFIAGNIKNGVSLFGLVGNLIKAPRIANGTINITMLNGQWAYGTVTGLAFNPKMIILTLDFPYSDRNYTATLVNVLSGNGLGLSAFYHADKWAAGASYTYEYIQMSGSINGTTNQISIGLLPNNTVITTVAVKWYAVE